MTREEVRSQAEKAIEAELKKARCGMTARAFLLPYIAWFGTVPSGTRRSTRGARIFAAFLKSFDAALSFAREKPVTFLSDLDKSVAEDMLRNQRPWPPKPQQPSSEQAAEDDEYRSALESLFRAMGVDALKILASWMQTPDEPDTKEDPRRHRQRLYAHVSKVGVPWRTTPTRRDVALIALATLGPATLPKEAGEGFAELLEREIKNVKMTRYRASSK